MSERNYSHLRVEATKEGTVVRLVGCPVLDELVSAAVGEELLELANRQGSARLLLDMGGVEFLTSTTLGLLVRVHKRVRTAGGALVLFDLRPEIHEVFTTTRLDQVFETRPAPAGP